jgi:hypothetical protein
MIPVVLPPISVYYIWKAAVEVQARNRKRDRVAYLSVQRMCCVTCHLPAAARVRHLRDGGVTLSSVFQLFVRL